MTTQQDYIPTRESSQLKIALVTPYFFPTIGGYSTFAYNLAKALSSLGHNVDIITCDSSEKYLADLNGKVRLFSFPRRKIGLAKRLSILKVPAFRNLCIFYSNESFVLDASKFLSQNKYDVVHTNGFPFEALPCTFRPGAASVHTFHTQPIARANFLSRMLSRRLFTAVKKSTCVSKRIADEIPGKLGIDVSTVIVNGVDLELFAPVTKKEDSALVVGTVTNFNWKEKAEGIKVLIDAIARLKHSKLKKLPTLTIVGSGSKFKEEISGHAVKSGIQGISMRTASYSEMPAIYNEFDVYVHSSKQEGFPMSILEAMASGKPIVTTAAFPELAEHKSVHFAATRDEVSEKLYQFFSDSDFMRKQQSLARQEAANFSWQTVAKRYLQLYGETVDQCKLT